MRTYPGQPEERAQGGEKELAKFIIDFLKDELPDCLANEWFIESVYLANMVDGLVEEINDK